MTISPQTMDPRLNQDHQPRAMVFTKIEKIIQEMQHPDTGVPVRCQKIFLTTIPSAFTGYDLVEWLMAKLHMIDSTEAIHLANLFCQYGYIFPVTDARNLTVKDDNSLYRFQSPYFWPSKNRNPDNIEYAIYLTKRTLRNKQRHGLDEYEQDAYNKLQKILFDKSEFIHMQADEQVRLAKERKKADKVVVDSQEKAYWKIHRPAPGQTRCLDDETIKRHYKPNNLKKKKTLEAAQAEVQKLNARLLLPRMKVSKAIECLIQRCQLYAEHDPFIGGALPSNPWVSEDDSMWLLNTVLVDTPTERRVKRWAFGLHELLLDDTGRHAFETYLKKEYSQENIRFWSACEDLKYGPYSQIVRHTNEIYKEFLAPGAPCEINIDGKTMELTQKNLKNPTRYTFDAAQAHVFALMKRDSYQRFLRSEDYKNLLANALQPCSKKKFGFPFGAGKKKTPNPSPQPKRRGSTSSERNSDASSMRSSSGHQHSYSTGNLQELDCDKQSSNSKTGESVNASPERVASPRTLRRKLDNIAKNVENSPQKNLEVPKQYPVHASEDGDMDTSDGLEISVPAKNCNVVAPWEDED